MQQQKHHQQGVSSRAERLSFSLTRQLAPQDAEVARQLRAPPSSAHDGSSGAPHSQQTAAGSVLDNSIVYLGETCVLDVVLANAGAPVTALTLKIEASIEGGSSAVLHDNAAAPLPALQHGGQHGLRVSTDVKEQGQLTVVASAVFTDPTGERKYHVQFFKFTAASPVSVRTRVRHLPHVCSGQQQQQHAGQHAASTRCFLEANVQNSTQLRMLLHAVWLLAAPGVHATLLSGASAPLQRPQLDQQPGLAGGKPPAAAAAEAAHLGSSDTSLQPDIDSLAPAGTADAPSAQQQQQQQQQQQPGEAVLLLAGSSQNTLWQIDHHILGGSSSAGGGGDGSGSGGAAAGGSPASTLGRLELHWSTCDGRTGRLLTQPLSGPVPASGKEVLMQLSRLWTCSSSSSTALDRVREPQQQQQFSECVPVNQLFRAEFRLTAGQHSVGPLLLLYSAALPGGPSSTTPPSLGSSSAGGSGQQLALADSSSIQQACGAPAGQACGAAGGDAAGLFGGAEVVVQGGRSVRVPGLAAGQSVEVGFELLPLRPGWLRLPTFVVASEADGRLLDGVHDVHVLAAARADTAGGWVAGAGQSSTASA